MAPRYDAIGYSPESSFSAFSAARSALFVRSATENIGEHHVATNADIQDVDMIFVEEDDRIVSRIGAKGVGEIGRVAVSAAVSNAIYHATGRRLCSAPMTPDKVMKQ